jgi:hypothetical protein
MSAATGSDTCHALWLIWGALTDWVENRPTERAAAEEKMSAAAREWLTVEGDEALTEAYCQRWVYDEMGYERRQ